MNDADETFMILKYGDLFDFYQEWLRGNVELANRNEHNMLAEYLVFTPENLDEHREIYNKGRTGY